MSLLSAISEIENAYGKASARRRKVISHISSDANAMTFGGDDFKVEVSYYPKQRPALRIHIPRYKLQTYSDMSGPTLHVYCGNNWTDDAHQWYVDCGTLAKLHRRARTYLSYCGSDETECETRHNVSWAPGAHGYLNRAVYHVDARFLINDHDMDREYRADQGEPQYYVTEEIFAVIETWLRQNVLKKLVGKSSSTTKP